MAPGQEKESRAMSGDDGNNGESRAEASSRLEDQRTVIGSPTPTPPNRGSNEGSVLKRKKPIAAWRLVLMFAWFVNVLLGGSG
jgi:hypothetical protein